MKKTAEQSFPESRCRQRGSEGRQLPAYPYCWVVVLGPVEEGEECEGKCDTGEAVGETAKKSSCFAQTGVLKGLLEGEEEKVGGNREGRR